MAEPVPFDHVHAHVPLDTAPAPRRRGADLDPPFERKFVVPAATAAAVAAWAAAHLRPDPHAGASRGDGYRVTSLYLDTPAFDVYHRRGSFGRAKYRVRRYDDAPRVFLERKCKVKGRVRKRRTAVADGELGRLLDPGGVADWPGAWFARRVAARGLAPSCVVRYERVACVGSGPHGPIRLTIDRDFLCAPGDGFGVPDLAAGGARELFAGLGVVELKYRRVMPALFKGLLADLGLTPARASKYRAAVVGCGLVAAPAGGEVGDA